VVVHVAVDLNFESSKRLCDVMCDVLCDVVLYDRCAQACDNCEVKAYIAEPLKVPSAPQLCAYFGRTDPSWHRRQMDFELKIMSEEKSHMSDGAKPPSREECEPEPEATIEVLTKTALETPIPTTPTMK
jgi:hypothetical protein